MKSEYIFHFNKSVEKLFQHTPTDTTLLTIEKYREEWNSSDYYETLDNLGFKVGIEYFVQSVLNDETDKVVSYIPCIKLHRNNPLTGQFKVIEFSEFKSINEAYGYIAKELVYRLRMIHDLDSIIASR